MNATTINFRAAARELCREKQFNNVDLIETAMIKGAELMAEHATKMVSETGQKIRDDHATTHAPNGPMVKPI